MREDKGVNFYENVRHYPQKRDGGELTTQEIKFFIDGYVKGEIPDYQASALLMAIFFKGMNFQETADLTFAVRDSGQRLDFRQSRVFALTSTPRVAWVTKQALWLRRLLRPWA